MSYAPDRHLRRRRLLDGGRATRCSTTTCSRSPAGRGRGSASCPSASGDADHYIVRFYRALRRRPLRALAPVAVPARARRRATSREHLLSQDLIYVGGGSVISLLGVWRAHGIDAILREAWERGRRPLRAQRRLAVLVRRGRHRVPRRAASGCEGSACCRGATPSTTTSEPDRREALPSWLARRDARRLRRRRRRGPALRRRATSRRWSRRGPSARAYRVELRRPHVVDHAARDRATSADRDSCRWSAPSPRWPRLPHGRDGSGRRAAILALGGDEFSRRRGNAAIRDYMLGLAPPPSGRGSACCRPRAATRPTRSPLLLEPSASATASPPTSRCSGSGRRPSTCATHLLAQDLIYVGGGSMLNLLAIWRAHGVDEILREAWERGVVLCRPERRRDVLVRVGRDAAPRRRPARRRAWA